MWRFLMTVLSIVVVTIGSLNQHAIGAEPTVLEPAERAFFERITSKREPDLSGESDRLPEYLQVFERELINDTRLFPCPVEAVPGENGAVVLKGTIGFSENRLALQKFLMSLGFDQIENRVEVLPARDLGSKRFGFIRTTHSFSFDKAAGRKEVLTDCLLGTPVFLLAEAGDGFFLCHGLEGYVGYVSGQDIHRVDSSQFAAYQSGGQVRLRRDHAIDGLMLPMGARLKLDEREKDCVIVEFPDGDQATLPVDCCGIDDGGPDPQIERVIAAAEKLLGTPYVWGGNTSEGIDCSGLVQTSFATEGITLARDSNQQVLVGRLVATRWYREGLRRGDTLYFLGKHGKIRHTGIYLGNRRYIEAVRPVVRYSSFDPDSAEYSRRGDETFCFGKRLLD